MTDHEELRAACARVDTAARAFVALMEGDGPESARRLAEPLHSEATAAHQLASATVDGESWRGFDALLVERELDQAASWAGLALVAYASPRAPSEAEWLALAGETERAAGAAAAAFGAEPAAVAA